MLMLSRFWSIIFMSTLLGHAFTADFVMFKPSLKAKLNSDDVTLTKMTDSIERCAFMCRTETSFFCETFSWRSPNCLLSDKIKINEMRNYLDWSEDWITYCRVTYPVYLVQSVKGRYQLTFAEAQTECKKRGTSIASRKDLLEARGMGYHMCVCGWLSDGTGGFVLQFKPSKCTHIYHTGVIDWCRGLMNVYCKILK